MSGVSTAMSSGSLWGMTWRRYRRSTLATLAVCWIVLMAVTALLAPLLANGKPLLERTTEGLRAPAFSDLWNGGSELARRHADTTILLRAPVPYSPNAIDLKARLSAPDRDHWLGTDDLGRDVLARMIHGARVSLSVGLFATAIALLVGSLLGALAGYYGGLTDWMVSRVIEVVVCFPFFFLALGIVALFKPSLSTIMIALGLTSWTSEARFIRGEFLRIRDSDYAQAARATGAGDLRIIFRHLLPNALAPVIVSASFGVAMAILAESALSYLGLGVPLPTASWGGMLSSAHEHIEYAWWLVLFPGLGIFSAVAAFNVAGERFQESLDTRYD